LFVGYLFRIVAFIAIQQDVSRPECLRSMCPLLIMACSSSTSAFVSLMV
jgi:hypothetical protein